MSFDKFTDKARKVLVLAQEEARGLHQPYVGTEHVLLALLKEEDGLAAQALERLGVHYEATVADKHGVHVEEGWGTGKIIAELFEECVEETLIQPIFVTDHPIEVSPLAKRKIGEDEVADRFELFISGHEYANAFNELNDPVDQAA